MNVLACAMMLIAAHGSPGSESRTLSTAFRATTLSPHRSSIFITSSGKIDIEAKSNRAIEVNLVSPLGVVTQGKGSGTLKLSADVTSAALKKGYRWDIQIKPGKGVVGAANGELNVSCPAVEVVKANVETAPFKLTNFLISTGARKKDSPIDSIIAAKQQAENNRITNAWNAARTRHDQLFLNKTVSAKLPAGSPAKPHITSVSADIYRYGEPLEIIGTGLAREGGITQVLAIYEVSNGFGGTVELAEEFGISHASATRILCRRSKSSTTPIKASAKLYVVVSERGRSNEVGITIMEPTTYRAAVVFSSDISYGEQHDQTRTHFGQWPQNDNSPGFPAEYSNTYGVWHEPRTLEPTALICGDSGEDVILSGCTVRSEFDIVDSILFKALPSPSDGGNAQITASGIGTRSMEFKVSWWRNPMATVKYAFAVIIKGPN